MLSAACLIGTVLLTSRLAESPALAVYALSFWHYLFYWWAYRHGAVPTARFRGDAVLMKSVALAALASVYLTQPWHWDSAWHWSSALAIGTGFMLNLAGARALGHTRTYYASELGELSPQLVTRFPYSVVPHPMLAGNMLAFGGTLLHPGFRQTWWPLAILHVALNGALIVMETSVTPSRRTVRTATATATTSTATTALATTAPATTAQDVTFAAGAAFAASVAAFAVGVAVAIAIGAFASGGAALLEWPVGWAPVAIVAAASAVYGYSQRGWYVPAASPAAPRSHTRSREVV